ncbi:MULTISPECIES: DUF3093 domain-containing protein [Agromyces]|jgi:hypothetical protein|uniref:DUF3093 domain-containing protein n=1 Tax=Agromyces indicus TaxID=758919 RepID=A0ABU1FLD8_9MICO|nr:MULTISPECIES: DUF3093 domain-containing protein [Agromyces]KZE94025.1 hypothetical protein AVP42_01231 [Agromyces sp. NDB4Y10]MCK8610322.1 DUF3093 domain-containing protein [Agromyces sp. C10]MDR5692115.1 DUF3093 domain-containing protein [Agromyces indicus]
MPEYRERLWPTPWIYLISLLLIPSSILVLAPVSVPAGVVTGLLMYAAVAGSLTLTAPVVEVSGGEFRAGRARVPIEDVGTAVPAVGEDARVERGTGLDARAHLVIRGWIRDVVRVPITDAADPAPYWLVSTRHPNELAAAINGSRRPGVGEERA